MGWMNLNDVLRNESTAEAEWAAKYAPNTAKAPRGYRITRLVDPQDWRLRPGETGKERIVRLGAKYTPTAIADAARLSQSRINQVLKEERDRVGAV